MPDVFISYSRRDKHFVERLNQGLEARGKDAWLDVDDIPVSAQWLSEIQEAIDSSDAFLVVLSPDSLASTECAREVDLALDRRKRILPIVFRDVDPGEVRPEVASINWVYLREHDPFDSGLDVLVKALDTDLDHVKAHTRLGNAAIDWDRSGRDRARLLRGSELQEAERWLTQSAAKDPGPTEVQAEFVQASRDAARRRGRMLFGGVAVALVVAVALAIVALIQRSNAIHQSQIAYSRQLDAQAQNQYSTDPELSVLLAVQAARAAPGAATREALRQALVQSHVRERYTNPSGKAVGDAVWSPRGDRLLIAYEGANKAEIVQPGTDAKPLVLGAPGLNSQIGWDERGRLAITGGAETQIWNGLTGRLVRRLPTRSADAALSPDGRRVATVDTSGILHLWSVATGSQLLAATPATRGAPGCLRWSPDGSRVAVCNVGLPASKLSGTGSNVPETLTVFSSNGRRLMALHEPQLILDLAFSPDSKHIALAVAASDQAPGTLVYDIATRARLLALAGSSTAVAFSPDGKELAYGRIHGNIAYVHTFAGGVDVPLQGSSGTIQSIAFSHTGTYVAISSGDGKTRVYNSFFGYQLEVLAGDTDEVTNATFSPDDSLLATASNDGTARVWATPVPHALVLRHPAPYQQYVSVSPDGSAALLAGPASRTALVLDPRTLSARATLTAPGGQVFGAGAFSPDGRWIAGLSGEVNSAHSFRPVQLELYNRRSAKLVATIAPAGTAVQDATFDHRGDLATLFVNGEVDLWSAATGRRQRTLLPAGHPASTLALSQDGSKLAVSYEDGSIDLLNAAGRRLHTLSGPKPAPLVAGVPASLPVLRVDFSPDGSWLAVVGAGNGVNLFSVSSGRLVRALKAGSEPLISLAFSPHGDVLAGGDAATAYLWRFPSGIPLHTLVHADRTTFGAPSELSAIGGARVAFSSDGGTLMTSGDLQTRLWNVQTGESLLTIPFAVGGAATPGAQQVLADSSGVLGVFSCDVCGGLSQLLASARRDLTRGLTPAERALYLRQS